MFHVAKEKTVFYCTTLADDVPLLQCPLYLHRSATLHITLSLTEGDVK